MAETVLAKMAVEIAANTAQFTKGLQSTQSQLKSFTSGLTNMAKTVGIAFGAQQVAAFAFEVAKLAGEAEGVKAAFDKLPNSVQLMTQLKEATAGTVSELELMKRTVQAANFGISLESLPKLLEFAAIRAQQTGQSVDYLVDSIVTGIGRKSPLILDNLGISAVRLKEKLGDVSIAAADIGTVSEAVGAIAEEELKKMGDFSENTATKVARLEASWTNFKVSLGKSSFVGALADATEGFLNFFNTLLGGQPSTEQMKEGLDFLIKGLNSGKLNAETYATAFKEAGVVADRLGIRLIKLTDEASGLSKVLVDTTTQIQTIVGPGTQQQITTLDSLQEKIKELNEQFESTNIVDQKRLSNIGAEIIAVNSQIKKLEELRKAREASNLNPNTVDAYQSALSELNKELENTNVNDTEKIRILSAQIAGYQEAIANVEALKKSFQDFDAELIIPVPDLSGLTNPIKTIQESVGGITFDRLTTSLDEVTKRFESGLAKMAETSKVRTEEIKAAFIDLGPLISNSLVGIGEALGGAIAGTENFGQAILKVVVGFAKQLGEILIATGVGMIAAKALITNPYTAIIAGIALVALASAAGAAISSSHAKSFGGSAGGSSSGGGRATSTGAGERFSRSPADQTILIGGEIKWNGNTLALALDRAYKSKERTG